MISCHKVCKLDLSSKQHLMYKGEIEPPEFVKKCIDAYIGHYPDVTVLPHFVSGLLHSSVITLPKDKVRHWGPDELTLINAIDQFVVLTTIHRSFKVDDASTCQMLFNQPSYSATALLPFVPENTTLLKEVWALVEKEFAVEISRKTTVRNGEFLESIRDRVSNLK